MGAAILLIIIISSVAGGGKSKTDSASSPTTKAGDVKAVDSASTTVAAVKKTCKDTPNTESFDSKKQGLYPDRLGVTKTDHEAAVGDCVRVSGATTYVTGFEVVDDSTSFSSGQLIVVTISETNRDKSPKHYTSVDWKLQTPKGILLDSKLGYGMLDGQSTALDSAELVTGATVDGTVAFEYSGPGTYYVIFDQVFSLGSDLGVWGITVP